MTPTLITFTSCVSDLTYRGHPSVDENFVDCSSREVPWPDTRHHWRSPHTDPVETLRHLKGFLSRRGQPVTWVINDNEYKNLNGTLPLLRQYQSEGDSVLVTYEIVERPAPVDRKDTEAVLRYAQKMCEEAGLRIDGVWSLKFWPSDLAALRRLAEEWDWAANLAGSCWLQEGHVDDSGWRGCPYGPYYVADGNVKGSRRTHRGQGLVMMPWLTRDFAAGIQLDRVEAYGMDPADPARSVVGGFGTEKEAGAYLADLADMLLHQSQCAPSVLRIHEEVRLYFDEGHDKDAILTALYDELDRNPGLCRKTTLREAFRAFREENPEGAARYAYSGRCLDPRFPSGRAALYEDGDRQIHFSEAAGGYPLRIYDYTSRAPDNGPYPLSMFPVLPVRRTEEPDGICLTFAAAEEANRGQMYGYALWDRPELNRLLAEPEVWHWKGVDGTHLLIFPLRDEARTIRLVR